MVKSLPFAGTHILVSLSLYEQLQRGNSTCFVLTQRRQIMEWREKKKSVGTKKYERETGYCDSKNWNWEQRKVFAAEWGRRWGEKLIWVLRIKEDVEFSTESITGRKIERKNKVTVFLRYRRQETTLHSSPVSLLLQKLLIWGYLYRKS